MNTFDLKSLALFATFTRRLKGSNSIIELER